MGLLKHALDFPPDDWPDIELENAWIDVLVEKEFDVGWPLPPPPIPPFNDDGSSKEDLKLVKVQGPKLADVVFDIDGVRGKYLWYVIFEPRVSLIDHDSHASSPQIYLYEYVANPIPFMLASYTLTYDDTQKKSYVVRIWQDFSQGKNWIAMRITYEQTRDALLEQGLPPPAPPVSPCPP